MKIFIPILFFVISVAGHAQSFSADEAVLKKGEYLFKIHDYDSAMDVLHPLTEKTGNPAAPYAGYYYALSAYENGFEYLALEMANYVVINYPAWDHINELRLWLVKFYMEDKNYPRARESVEAVTSDKLRKLAESIYMNKIDSIEDYNDLVDLYEKYPDNKLIARVLADRIIRLPVILRDNILLDKLVNEFNFDKKKYNTRLDLKGRKKMQYNVAVLFPFMADDIVPGQSGRSNQFIYDIYEGLLIGAENLLRKEDINLKITAFDTRRSANVTRNLISSGELNGYDLIIGPLYPGPVHLISDFSYNHQIMIFNPLSTNSEIIRNDPFALLFRPSIERQSTAAARYASRKFALNKNYFLFYGNNSKDSINAYLYASILNKDSFNINFAHRLIPDDTLDIYKVLTRKIKLKDLQLSEEDSLELISHYKIDTAAISAAGKKIEEHEIFVMHPDSIGHIYGASSNTLIATSIISGVETRGDHTWIIGNEDWLDIQQLSLDQLDRLNIVLTAPGYINFENPYIDEVNDMIIDKTHAPPDKYHYLGFELISYIGHMFDKYGSPFINGLKEEGFHKGLIFYGFDYTNGQDNNLVPIIEFIDNDFRIVNDPETDMVPEEISEIGGE